jgi:hypothetical protein
MEKATKRTPKRANTHQFIGHFDHYPVRGCKECIHEEENPEGRCNYSDSKVYVSNDGKRMMVIGKCKNNQGRRKNTAFMKTGMSLAK